MKVAIMYVSKARRIDPQSGLPDCLTSIIVNARRFNQSNGLSGLLCFRGGYYLQIVEGEAEKIRPLSARILGDDRHEDIEIIYNGPVRGTYFPNWPLKLSSNCDGYASFKRFLRECIGSGGLLSADARACVQRFSDHLNSTRATAPLDFADEGFALAQWPRFDVFKPTRELMDLCAALVRGPVTYTELLAQNPFPTTQLLDEALVRLQASPHFRRAADPGVRTPPRLGRSSFFTKMKGFLSSFA